MKKIPWYVLVYLLNGLLTFEEALYIKESQDRCPYCGHLMLFHINEDLVSFIDEICLIKGCTCTPAKGYEKEQQENYKRRSKNEYGV